MSYYRASRTTMIFCIAALTLCGCGTGSQGREARLADLEQSVQELRARQTRLEDANLALRVELAAKNAGQSVIPTAEQPPEAKLEAARPNESGKIAVGEGMVAAPPRPPAERVQPTPAQSRESGAEKTIASKAKGAALYDEALRIYLAGRALPAREKFQEFMAEQPESPLMPNALYWTGETWYHEKDYAQAVLHFQEVVSRYPGHHKAADSLLKSGLSYERLGDKANAALYYQALLDDYPSASGAAQARARLKALQ